MRRTNRMVLGLVAVCVLGSSLALLGCGGGDDENVVGITAANASSLVGGKAFTFPGDTGFGIANANLPLILAFNSSASRFALSVSGSLRVATGTVTYGSCIFTVGPTTEPITGVGGGSNFPNQPPVPGPRPNQVIIIDSCQYDTENNALILNGVSSSITQGTGTGGFGG